LSYHLGVEAIDFWPIFRGQGSARYRVEEDGHPNGLAHKMIAEHLAKAIAELR
jgi:lysophospholipase L1-like esterase